jgi:hypothetical protein
MNLATLLLFLRSITSTLKIEPSDEEEAVLKQVHPNAGIFTKAIAILTHLSMLS